MKDARPDLGWLNGTQRDQVKAKAVGLAALGDGPFDEFNDSFCRFVATPLIGRKVELRVTHAPLN